MSDSTPMRLHALIAQLDQIVKIFEDPEHPGTGYLPLSKLGPIFEQLHTVAHEQATRSDEAPAEVVRERDEARERERHLLQEIVRFGLIVGYTSDSRPRLYRKPRLGGR